LEFAALAHARVLNQFSTPLHCKRSIAQ